MKHTEEAKQKIRLSKLGKKAPWVAERNRKYRNFGKKHTEETKRKMSLLKGGNGGVIVKCLNCTKDFETKRRNRSFCSIKCANFLKNKARIGKVLSPEHKMRLSGENHPQWKGGISINYKRKSKTVTNCEVCGISESSLKKQLCYDHDHKTGKFRGWICFKCNVALGMVDDNWETLQALMNYLIKST